MIIWNAWKSVASVQFLNTNNCRPGAGFRLPRQRGFPLAAAEPCDQQPWRQGESLWERSRVWFREKAWQSLDWEQPGNSSSCVAPATCCLAGCCRWNILPIHSRWWTTRETFNRISTATSSRGKLSLVLCPSLPRSLSASCYFLFLLLPAQVRWLSRLKLSFISLKLQRTLLFFSMTGYKEE